MSDLIASVNPVAVYSDGVQQAVTVINNSTSDSIYLGKSANDSKQGNGLPLGPLSSVIWDAKTPLYVTGPLAGASFSVVQNEGPISNPGAIASQLISQGLATAVANAIYQVGTPNVDKITQLSLGSVIIQSGLSGFYPTGGTLDVQGARSLIIQCSSICSTVQTTVRRVRASWTIDSAGNTEIATTYFYVAVNNGKAYLTINTKGPYVQFYMVDGEVTTTNDEMFFWVYGSTAAVTYDRCLSRPAALSAEVDSPHYTGTSGTARWSGVACATGTPTTTYVYSYGGKATLSTFYSGTDAYIVYLRMHDGTTLDYFNQAAGDKYIEGTQLILPMGPVRIDCSGSTGNTFSGTLVMEGAT